ncbi:MAG: hypothetical protein Unbinned6284contig1004_30 [Prokaryotic dsDNA virus sp.]|nr:MAG: hypothetical protein Unbinned6284contig1004_30 [Prokaryotic dsDNA virus sp.]|tara:strand:- start:422 stop:661 length:240 start_codon:yes stop_codon:yes gene_type:complete
MKECTKCYKELPVEMFYVNRAKKDGRSSQCKNCINGKVCYDLKSVKELERQNKAYRLRIDNLMQTIDKYEKILFKNNLM